MVKKIEVLKSNGSVPLRQVLKGAFDPKVKKCIVAVVPHTSWHDFFVGLFLRKVTGVKTDSRDWPITDLFIDSVIVVK